VLCAGRRGAVVIGMAPFKLSTTRQALREIHRHPRLAFDSPFLFEEFTRFGLKPPGRTGVYFLDHIEFFAARAHAVFRFWRGPIVPRRHSFSDDVMPWDDHLWANHEPSMAHYRALFPEHVQDNLDLLARIVKLVRSKADVDIILADVAWSSRGGRFLGEAYLQEVDEALARFCSAHGVIRWDLRRMGRVTDEDFYDLSHIRKQAARERICNAMVERLTPLLRARMASGGGDS
jgi:hypothetical protein